MFTAIRQLFAFACCGMLILEASGCDSEPGTPTVVTEKPAAAPPPAADQSSLETLEEALASPHRPAEDKALDDFRKPREVIQFLGIKPGMKVLDLMAGGGYYTDILSAAVSPGGWVYAHNTALGIVQSGRRTHAEGDRSGYTLAYGSVSDPRA